MKSSKRQTHSSLKLPEGRRFVVAFSGGIDSLALVLMMKKEERKRSAAVYVDHSLRPREELDEEISLNIRNARALSIPLYIIRLGEGSVSLLAKEKDIGIEAAARTLRYEALERFRSENGYDFILTAHHLDDQSETLLMRMLSSSTFWAWAGIRRREGNLIRPILSTTKDEIRRVVVASGLKWSEDSTNSDLSYRRNWIRRNILPSLSLEAKRTMEAIAENVSSFPGTQVAAEYHGSFWVKLDRSSFLSSRPWDREKAIFSSLSRLGNRDRIRRGVVREIEKGAERGSGRTEIGDIVIRYRKNSIDFYCIPQPFLSPYRGEETLLPLGLSISTEKGDSLSLRIPDSALKGAYIRKNSENDVIELRDGERKVSSLLKEYHLPYAMVLEKGGIIEAVFMSFLGGRDRLDGDLIGKNGIIVAINPENS